MSMYNRMDARVIELEDQIEQITQLINSLIQRIEKLEAAENLRCSVKE